jgi:hypothetical protein
MHASKHLFVALLLSLVDDEINVLRSHLKRSEEESQRKATIMEQLEEKLDATKRAGTAPFVSFYPYYLRGCYAKYAF